MSRGRGAVSRGRGAVSRTRGAVSRGRVARLPALLLAASCLAGAPGRAEGATRLFITNHVNSNEVQGLADWQGDLALATFGGIVFADPGTGTLTKTMRSPGGLPSNKILCVAGSPSGSLWAGTADEGIARMKPDGAFRRPLTSFDGLPSDRVQTLYVTGDTVWVGTSGGVALLTENPVTGQVLLRRSDTSASTFGALVSDDVAAFQRVGDTLWCATAKGLSTFAGGAWASRAATLGVAVRALAFHADTLWAGTAAGPRRYDGASFALVASGHAGACIALHSDGGQLVSGTSSAGVFRYSGGAWAPLGPGLPSPRAQALATAAGSLWAGTPAGLARYQSSAAAWTSYISEGPAVNGSQRATADSRGLWLATGNFFPPATGLGAVLHYDGSSWSAITPVSTSGALQATDVFSVLSDRAGSLWFGHCCGTGDPRPRVDRWDPAGNTWDRPATTNIYALAQAPSGRIYGGSVEHGNGVYEFDGATAALLDSLTPLNTDVGVGPGLSSNNLRGIAFDTAGRAWIANAFAGLDIVDERGTVGDHTDDVWVHLATGFPSTQTTAVVTDGPRSGWVGTAAGVVRIANDLVDPATTSAVNARLSVPLVKDLALDTGGNLWIATAGGLARVDAATRVVESFTVLDGLAGDDVRALAWDSRRGALWAGTTEGVSEIYPGSGSGPSFGDGTYLYPNPIDAGATALRLGGITGEVEGEVRDLSGAMLKAFRCDPTQNEAWDLRGGDGSPAAPGIYLIVLRDGGRSRVLRAALVR